MIILLRTVFVLNEDEVNHTELTLCVSKIRVDNTNTSKTTLSELLALPDLETLLRYSYILEPQSRGPRGHVIVRRSGLR